MAYIKKMVMQGFKSFAKKTEIFFDRGVNVILGPNGSGKSNIGDALCFVLGRLSIKSMRASKSKNLLFMGSKYMKPTHESSVEIVFDNKDRIFKIDKDEICLSRTIRKNGIGVYKINEEIKNRAEIIETLAQAGIDPYGFNLILQGQIQSIVRMHTEERRKIVEEVAGISIYESRKEKSLHELEKTDEKLKEIGTILRERTAYLRNLERERAQALRYKELEINIKRCKASILQRKIDEKQKETDSINKSIEDKSQQKNKIKEKIEKIELNISEMNGEILKINKNIQQSTGIEQETLHSNVANLRAEIEGIKVRKEGYEHRKEEIERRIKELKKSIPDFEEEIEYLKRESPLVARKSEELKKKKDELAILENEKNRLLSSKSELVTLKEIIKDKEKQMSYSAVESESIIKQMEIINNKLKYKNEEECLNSLHSLRKLSEEKDIEIDRLKKELFENEKISSVSEIEVKKATKIIDDVNKIDTCPLCQSKITEEHVEHVKKDSYEKISNWQKSSELAKEKIKTLNINIDRINKEIYSLKDSIYIGEAELIKIRNIKDKNENLKRAVSREKAIKEELNKLEERRKFLENKIDSHMNVQEKYDMKILEIEEISSRTLEDVDTSLLYKERELENTKNIIKRSSEDLKELILNIKEINDKLNHKIKSLEDNEEKERELNKRFKKMFEHRDSLQINLQEENLQLSEKQNENRQIDDQINYLKLGKARADAEREALIMEISDCSGVEIIQGSQNSIEDRMQKAQEALRGIGNINMRALEVYDEIKKEYDIVYEKVQTLEKEKQEILKIIEEIDKKKTRSFMKTFKSINELFSRNFSKLYTKGVAFLEIENEEDIFAGGVSIVVKLAKGKYFDVASLSGGEQTLVALSLLFAIQEYKPYHFYIFDEIDAALDKRNSERLAALLTQYMKSGQYIVITHNDAIIMNSNVLYGVSMQDGVSKILSLKVDKEQKKDDNSSLEETNAIT